MDTGTRPAPGPRPFEPVEVRLPGHAPVWGVGSAETMSVWREMTPDGMYGRAAARLRPGDRVLDIGANVGLASVFFHDVQPGITTVAVEPAPDLYACLQANLAAHVPGSRAVRAAVTDRVGHSRFVYYPNAPSNSGLHTDPVTDDALTRRYLENSGVEEEFIEMVLEGLHDGVSLEVPTLTVSTLLRERPYGDIALLKVDVERAELEVLRGVEAADWPRIGEVVAEVHDEGGRLDACCDLLRAQGFHISVDQDPALAGTELYEIEARRA
ncbi:FkbM family methyltransferase [Micromonospora sp. A202]|uniref:FkbM family methyltransferase n=1 Tax=Micromonospora sp. A202 TaxID=2572899 RepID=UPI001150BDCD|nr:FkbM family methyltransferase [Micromonospora sp. A202]TQJ23636.1 FkbM family methyltransferase [Micromonospora sp. A202]